MVPPATGGDDAAALALAPGAGVAPLEALGAVVEHAAITAPMAGNESPMTEARWMNWRRVIRPLAYASTTSSSKGVADRRTRSKREKSMVPILLDHVTDP
ncbi:MAG: hypothetical protein ACXW4T_01820 [Candidatus Limnocylindrales bacterium]